MVVSTHCFHPEVNLEFKNISYSVRVSQSKKYGVSSSVQLLKPILKDVSGSIKAGQLTAIMGPSGAGKSTLMNVLAGYKSNVQGTIMVNGKPRELAKFRKLSCYIMQDDSLLPTLSVMETMGYAAQLKLPTTTTKKEREILIDEILENIGLTDCKNVRSGQLSGGQRKRLAISLELINNPPVMFLDEAVTGLDICSAYSLVLLLKALADGGRTIITTIHQPSAKLFEQFDSLYLLAKGHCLYRGSIKSLVPYFAEQGLVCQLDENPADFAIELASGHFGEEWISLISKCTRLNLNSDDHQTIEDSSEVLEDTSLKNNKKHSLNVNFKNGNQTKTENGNSDVIIPLLNANCATTEISVHSLDQELNNTFAKHWNEFQTLVRRSFLCISRDVAFTRMRVVVTIVIALIIGLTFRGAGNNATKVFDNYGYHFTGLLLMSVVSLMVPVVTFPLESDVVVREHLNCWYSLRSYFLARLAADFPFQLLFPLLYTTITYWMTSQPQEVFRFAIVFLTNTIISIVGQSVGFLVGASCNVQTASIMGPITTIPVFMFGGLGSLSLDGVPVYLKWISWFSYMRHAFKTNLTAIYGFGQKDLICNQPYCHYKDPQRFLLEIGASDVNVFLHINILLILAFVVYICAFYALKLKMKSGAQ